MVNNKVDVERVVEEVFTRTRPWTPSFVFAACRNHNNLLASLKELIAIVKLYIEAAGGCDHSVGICMCGDIRALEQAEELVQKIERVRP